MALIEVVLASYARVAVIRSVISTTVLTFGVRTLPLASASGLDGSWIRPVPSCCSTMPAIATPPEVVDAAKSPKVEKLGAGPAAVGDCLAQDHLAAQVRAGLAVRAAGRIRVRQVRGDRVHPQALARQAGGRDVHRVEQTHQRAP